MKALHSIWDRLFNSASLSLSLLSLSLLSLSLSLSLSPRNAGIHTSSWAKALTVTSQWIDQKYYESSLMPIAFPTVETSVYVFACVIQFFFQCTLPFSVSLKEWNNKDVEHLSSSSLCGMHTDHLQKYANIRFSIFVFYAFLFIYLSSIKHTHSHFHAYLTYIAEITKNIQ